MFVFAFTERSIVTGSNVMRANLQLIRALYFPRASLPLAYVIVELQQMLVGMVVLVPVMLVSGESLSRVLVAADPRRAAADDVQHRGGADRRPAGRQPRGRVSELIPFILRITRYFCGVMYLIITLPAAVTTSGASSSCR